MANTANILEVTLAQISDATVRPNIAAEFGLAPIAGVKQTRSWSYEPMVVRVTNHPADDGSTGDVTEGMALFQSRRHGEPWIMVGHQTEHLIWPLAGAAPAPITTETDAFQIIYPDFDYTTFE
tara:strand:- start:38 stop:406 length:369 start_codon:yes stop_codon:yes gene_type:complete